jgi:hypothetical protein
LFGLAEEGSLLVLRGNVDGYGDGLGERVAIAADKSRDLAELVVLEELGRGVPSLYLDGLKLEAIGLRDREDGGGAGVELCDKALSSARLHQ